jgi:5-methylcytosine-specific restriction endonuclease McrA
MDRNISNLSDNDLIQETKSLVQEERRVNILILRHLQEFETRKLHLILGFPSLFEYAVKELGYSESAAYRRIQAMRLTRKVPEVEGKIASGALNLTVAAQVQSFFANEKKSNHHYSKEEASELIRHLENKSTREVERVLVEINPRTAKPEILRAVSPENYELRICISAELKLKLDQLKSILSHQNPGMSYEKLIEHTAELALEKLNPARLISEEKPNENRKLSRKPPHKTAENQRKATPAPEVRPRSGQVEMPSRHIPLALRRKIWRRDQGRCTYQHPESGRRCDSTFQVQVDHIQEFALGGQHEESNLRLLCRAHNSHRAELRFGNKWKTRRPPVEVRTVPTDRKSIIQDPSF